MISGNLEYIISSLPYLSFNDTKEYRNHVLSILEKYYGTSVNEHHLINTLDQEASKFLAPKAYHLFKQINLSDIHKEIFQQSSNKFLSEFSKFVFRLKTDLLELRRSRKNEPESTLSKSDLWGSIPQSPLEAEIHLIKLQWDYLEECSIGHYADYSALVIYKLKFLLLLRWWSFDQKKGFDNFITISKLAEYGG
ncbi:DUF2764 family protein [Winogradskyella luteola]|uniref:DUF2764 family protein n=1 Tax=Winogradskyella luteola TaxID=2828330 RepID=A0A9X1FCM2_9FLAO|nr:DUF2764 family protein [Winogradskyella luteola]MBV7270628.1 DUF2764 family protein [Winogradskyella luteola]